MCLNRSEIERDILDRLGDSWAAKQEGALDDLVGIETACHPENTMPGRRVVHFDREIYALVDQKSREISCRAAR